MSLPVLLRCEASSNLTTVLQTSPFLHELEPTFQVTEDGVFFHKFNTIFTVKDIY
jgi:hypothetical protein